MQGEDRVGLPDRIAEVGAGALLEWLHLLGLAVDQRHGRHRDLVEQGPQGVGKAELARWIEVPSGGEDRDRGRLAGKLGNRARCEQVRLPWGGPDSEQGEPAPLLELAREL